MNYRKTFIQVAPDCPVRAAVVPVAKGGKKSVPVIEYELLSRKPYHYTQEELLFAVHVARLGIPPGELKSRREKLRAEFFSQPRACLRSSALTKRYGWGVHFDDAGKAALYPVEGAAYRRFAKSKNLTQLPALRSKRA